MGAGQIMETMRETFIKLLSAIERETPEQTRDRYAEFIPSITVQEAVDLKEQFNTCIQSGASRSEREKLLKGYRNRINTLQARGE